MGAVDLVIQIEAPPSVASGMQRIGRAGHSVGAASEGIIFPKYRADLVACAGRPPARCTRDWVESTRFLRNPLDVLAQQMVAIVAQPPVLALEDGDAAQGRRRKGAVLAHADIQDERTPGIALDQLYAIVACGLRHMPSCRAVLSKAYSICWPAAIPPMSSQNCGRG